MTLVFYAAAALVFVNGSHRSCTAGQSTSSKGSAVI